MLQQNSFFPTETYSIPTTVPYTFTTGELNSLRGKLQLAEQHSKNSQSIIQLSLNEIRTLQKMIAMTYLQGLSGSGVLPSIQQDMRSPMNMKSSGNTSTPPSNYVCHKCNIPGHYVQDCPNVSRGPPQNYLCRKCNISGHWIQECPLGNQQDYSKPSPPGYCCHRCGVPGHWIKHCPTNSLEKSSDEIERDTSDFGQSNNKFSHSSDTGGYLHIDKKDTDNKSLNGGIAVTQEVDQ